LAVLLIAAAAIGCADDPIAGKIATHDAARADAAAGPAKVATLIRVAAATEQAGDFATAAAFYRRAHQTNVHLARTDATPLLGLGRALAALGAHNEAAETFQAALKLAPDEPEALRGLGNALISLDQPTAAITNLEAALAKGPDARVYSSLGVANDLLDKRAEAQAAYRKGLELDPSSAVLRNNLGLSLAFGGEFEEGIAILERAAAEPRATMRQKLNLALAYGLAGDFAAAEAILRRHLDATATSNNLAHYRTLQALNDRKLAARSVGAHPPGAPAPGLLQPAVRPEEAPAASPEAPPEQSPATGPPLDLQQEVAPAAAAAHEPSDRDLPSVRPEEARRAVSKGVGGTRSEAADAGYTGIENSSNALRDARSASSSGRTGSHSVPRASTPPRAGGPVQVQLAAFRSKGQAEASWRRLSAAAPDLLAGIAPVIEEGFSGADPAPYFRVRSAPLASRGEADDLCARLKARGIDCMIVRGAP
jgi:Flp pilus assembly protein TadD